MSSTDIHTPLKLKSGDLEPELDDSGIHTQTCHLEISSCGHIVDIISESSGKAMSTQISSSGGSKGDHSYCQHSSTLPGVDCSKAVNRLRIHRDTSPKHAVTLTQSEGRTQTCTTTIQRSTLLIPITPDSNVHNDIYTFNIALDATDHTHLITRSPLLGHNMHSSSVMETSTVGENSGTFTNKDISMEPIAEEKINYQDRSSKDSLISIALPEEAPLHRRSESPILTVIEPCVARPVINTYVVAQVVSPEVANDTITPVVTVAPVVSVMPVVSPEAVDDNLTPVVTGATVVAPVVAVLPVVPPEEVDATVAPVVYVLPVVPPEEVYYNLAPVVTVSPVVSLKVDDTTVAPVITDVPVVLPAEADVTVALHESTTKLTDVDISTHKFQLPLIKPNTMLVKLLTIGNRIKQNTEHTTQAKLNVVSKEMSNLDYIENKMSSLNKELFKLGVHMNNTSSCSESRKTPIPIKVPGYVAHSSRLCETTDCPPEYVGKIAEIKTCSGRDASTFHTPSGLVLSPNRSLERIHRVPSENSLLSAFRSDLAKIDEGEVLANISPSGRSLRDFEIDVEEGEDENNSPDSGISCGFELEDIQEQEDNSLYNHIKPSNKKHNNSWKNKKKPKPDLAVATEEESTNGRATFCIAPDEDDIDTDHNRDRSVLPILPVVVVTPSEADSDSDGDSSSPQIDLSKINPMLLAPFAETSGIDGPDGMDTSFNDNDTTGMDKLKKETHRLKLETRRASYTAWKETVVEKPYLWRHRIAHEVVHSSLADDWSNERINRVNEALTWIKHELVSLSILNVNSIPIAIIRVISIYIYIILCYVIIIK